MTTTVIVDDVTDIRTLIRVALRVRGGFDVVGEAGTGARAVELARKLSPELIVLDLGLPDLAAEHVVTQIRQASPTSRIVIFSGVDTDRTWFEQRASGYVHKDTDIAQLVDLLVAVTSAPDETTLELPADVLSARDARTAVSRVLRQWGYADLVDDASLVVTELVTNAVLHARSACAVVLSRSGGGVRIEVTDRGAGDVAVTNQRPTGEHGRGLIIVSAVATAWGTETSAADKRVWVELSPPPADPDP